MLAPHKEVPGLAQGRKQDQGPGGANKDEGGLIGLRESSHASRSP